jgi:hypothetical protein
LELVRCAVIADREVGATWEQIGRPHRLSVDAARIETAGPGFCGLRRCRIDATCGGGARSAAPGEGEEVAGTPGGYAGFGYDEGPGRTGPFGQ